MSKIKVEKTSNLNGRKLWRVSRQFMVAPIIIRDLQRGLVEELDEQVAKAMIAQGLVKRVDEKSEPKQETKKKKEKKLKSEKAEVAIAAIGEVDNIKTVVNEPDSNPGSEDDFSSTEDNMDEDTLSRKDIEL